MVRLTFPLPVDWRAAQGDLRTELAILLHFTLGLLRLEVDVPYALHRGIASPRSLHPTDLFVWLPADEAGLRAGLYQYRPLEHGLEYVGASPPVARAPEGITLYVGTDLSRIEPLYGALATRLATLEAGQAGALLERIAGALGWWTTLQPMVGPGLARGSTLGSGLLLALERRHGGGIPGAEETALLRRQVLERNSGAEYRGFATLDRPISLGRLRPAFAGALAVPGLDLFLVARRVIGLKPGIYQVEQPDRLRRIGPLRSLVPHTGIRESAIPVQLFLTASPSLTPVALASSAGMDLLNLRAGEAGQAIGLALGGELACRPSLSFDPASWLEATGPERLPLLSCLVGWNRFRPFAYNLTL